MKDQESRFLFYDRRELLFSESLVFIWESGAPGGIRTPGLLVRSHRKKWQQKI